VCTSLNLHQLHFDPTAGAYSAPPDPLAGLGVGPPGKRKEGREGERREGREWRAREGRESDKLASLITYDIQKS